MPDTGKWFLPLAAAGVCAAGMAVLVAGIALALGTTGHDWYAAWNLTLVEAMMAIGFDDYGLVEYRTAAGETVSVARYRLAYVMHEAWSARRMIMSLAADRAVLGACTGLSLFAMWLGVRAAVRLRRFWGGHTAVVEPAQRVGSGYAGRMERPEDWSDGELIATLARRSGRFGLLLVSPGEVERLARIGGDAVVPPATAGDSLPSARMPALPPSESEKAEANVQASAPGPAPDTGPPGDVAPPETGPEPRDARAGRVDADDEDTAHSGADRASDWA